MEDCPAKQLPTTKLANNNWICHHMSFECRVLRGALFTTHIGIPPGGCLQDTSHTGQDRLGALSSHHDDRCSSHCSTQPLHKSFALLLTAALKSTPGVLRLLLLLLLLHLRLRRLQLRLMVPLPAVTPEHQRQARQVCRTKHSGRCCGCCPCE